MVVLVARRVLRERPNDRPEREQTVRSQLSGRWGRWGDAPGVNEFALARPLLVRGRLLRSSKINERLSKCHRSARHSLKVRDDPPRQTSARSGHPLPVASVHLASAA